MGVRPGQTGACLAAGRPCTGKAIRCPPSPQSTTAATYLFQHAGQAAKALAHRLAAQAEAGFAGRRRGGSRTVFGSPKKQLARQGEGGGAETAAAAAGVCRARACLAAHLGGIAGVVQALQAGVPERGPALFPTTNAYGSSSSPAGRVNAAWGWVRGGSGAGRAAMLGGWRCWAGGGSWL